MNQSTEWWSTFFSGLAVESWARVENIDHTRREVDLLLKALRLAPGASVLDAPCGNGRHSLELAARGFRVTGVDLSAENVASARERGLARGVEATFHERDMRDLSGLSGFDAALCLGNSFAYFADEGNEAFLRGVHRALRPGGTFVLETGVAAESILGSFEKRAWYLVDDIYFLAERRHDPLRSRLDVEYTWIRGAHVEKKPASYRVYTLLEIVRLFESAGFEIAGAHASLEGAPYEVGSRLLCVTAVKR